MNNDEQLLKLWSIDSVRNCVKSWGIECYEDKVKEICKHPDLHPMRDYLISTWKEIYLGKKESEL